jgi:hypothetical protein
VREIVGRLWKWVVGGIAVGALFHGYVPEGWVTEHLGGKDNWLAVPGAVLLGIPLYSNATGVIPVAEAMLGKGVAIGTTLAFMMSIAALSLPEMIILRKVIKWPALALYAGCSCWSAGDSTSRFTAGCWWAGEGRDQVQPVALRLAHSSWQDRTTAGPMPSDARIRTGLLSWQRIEFDFQGNRHGFAVPGMLLLALLVGVVGGTYGIGGGAIIAPFCVALFGLPIHAVAGAALAATLLTSVFGVALYSLMPAPAGVAVRPDWALGLLFGLGGMIGMYLGARAQRHVPQRVLKGALAIGLLGLAVYYALGNATS